MQVHSINTNSYNPNFGIKFVRNDAYYDLRNYFRQVGYSEGSINKLSRNIAKYDPKCKDSQVVFFPITPENIIRYSFFEKGQQEPKHSTFKLFLSSPKRAWYEIKNDYNNYLARSEHN